jgi:predicted ATPase
VQPSPRPALTGRALELKRLEDALDGSGPPIFEVVGEPGIGKSRLLAELAARAQNRRYLVFSGRSAEFERQIPFGAVIDALDPYLASQNVRRFRSLSAEQRTELGALFPALHQSSGAVLEPLQTERYRAHRAVRSLVELLASERRCVLALDDVHWADESSLELIAHLLRRPPSARVLILLAFRPAQTPALLRAPLARAEREGTAERIELTPLERADAELLLDPSLSSALRHELFQRSGGNPFYLEQLARTTDPAGAVPRDVAEYSPTSSNARPAKRVAGAGAWPLPPQGLGLGGPAGVGGPAGLGAPAG